MTAEAAGPRTRLGDYMPIVNKRMAAGDYTPYYEEREITEPVDLCDERGLLNPEAVGRIRLRVGEGWCERGGDAPHVARSRLG